MFLALLSLIRIEPNKKFLEVDMFLLHSQYFLYRICGWIMNCGVFIHQIVIKTRKNTCILYRLETAPADFGRQSRAVLSSQLPSLDIPLVQYVV